MDDLRVWDDLSDDFLPHADAVNTTALLIGNGASIAVDNNFNYPSLLESAAPSHLERSLFEMTASSNFETVLYWLVHARQVCQRLGLPTQVIDEQYSHIRDLLIRSVTAIHIDRHRFGPPAGLGDFLVRHKSIFSLNYDLLIYWTLAAHNCFSDRRVLDVFPGLVFDSNYTVPAQSSVLYYLHGALHLYLDQSYGCCKRRSVPDQGLLSQLGFDEDFKPPHFVCEGTYEEKKAFIRRSEYLNYAHKHLRMHDKDIVVFGFSMEPAHDQHIIDSLRLHRANRRIAVSVFSELNPEQKTDYMNTVMARLRVPAESLLFYESESHPLSRGNRLVDLLFPNCDDD